MIESDGLTSLVFHRCTAAVLERCTQRASPIFRRCTPSWRIDVALSSDRRQLDSATHAVACKAARCDGCICALLQSLCGENLPPSFMLA